MKNSAASAQKIRCNWAEKSELERVYHDEEWGKLVKDDGADGQIYAKSRTHQKPPEAKLSRRKCPRIPRRRERVWQFLRLSLGLSAA